MKSKLITKVNLLLFLLAALLVFQSICTLFLSNAFSSATVFAAEEDYIYYDSYDSEQEIAEKGMAVNETITDEGIVMLKNDGLLPLSTTEEVAFLGRNTYHMLTNGGGAAAPKTFNDAYGSGKRYVADEYKKLGGSINETAQTYYSGSTFTFSGDTANMMDYSREMDSNKITSSVTTSIKNNSSVGVVTISRFGSEMNDLDRTESKTTGTGSHSAIGSYVTGGALNNNDHYLQLSPAELQMIDYANENCGEVILLINSANPIELGLLEDEAAYEESRGLSAGTYDLNVDAALWVGLLGYQGATSVANIMLGNINPSGKLNDIQPTDFKEDPVWMNQGLGSDAGGDVSSTIGYVHYEEDIYYGYKYWETRGYEEDQETGATDGEWYDDNVVYPFGYGLSYTTFKQEIAATSVEENATFDRETQFDITVKVTNTGSVAGKEVVQAYYTAPYTKGGIEKAYVNLVAFGKTDILEPGASQEVTVTFTGDDMKSYDWNDKNGNGIKGYELEKGDYVIRIASDSHNYLDDVTYTLTEDIHCKEDLETGTEVVNLFDEISTSEYGVTEYMSRADFEGTYPEGDYSGTQSNSEVEYECTEEDDMNYDFYVDQADMPSYATTAGTAETNSIKLYHMLGRDASDPLWDELMDQLTIEEMADIVGEGSYRSNALDSIGKPYTYESDGPTGWVSEETNSLVVFASTCILGSTFNVDIAEAFGEHLALEGNTARQHKSSTSNTVYYTGLYAPGVNLHRTQFCGRNFEYFSEDAVLTGYIAAAQVKAMTANGMAAYVKHFVLNEQETNRYLINTWASEQNMRENSCKAFEIVVKKGDAIAMMNAYNNVGNYQSGMLYNLNVSLLRGEWGYEGSLLSDWGSHTKMTNGVDAIIRGGVNHIMNNNNGTLYTPSTDEEDLTATHVTAIKTGAKNVLYKIANTSGMNRTGGAALTGSYTGGSIYAVSGADLSVSVDDAKGYLGLDADFSYSIATGSLPTGLSLNENGTISGKVSSDAALGDYTFTVAATEDNDAIPTTSLYDVPDATYTLQVLASGTASQIIVQDFTDTIDVTLGVYSSTKVTACVINEGTISYDDLTYTLKSGTLPTGMTLENGVISGTATDGDGDIALTIEVSADGATTKEVTVTLNVSTKYMRYTAFDLADMAVGTSVAVNVNTAEGYDSDGEDYTLTGISYAVSSTSSLPSGLSITSQGIITGTPLKGYTDYEFTIVASSKEANSVEATFSVNVIGVETTDFTQSVFIEENYVVDLNDYIKLNDGTEMGGVSFSVADYDGFALPSGWVLFADGTLMGNTSTVASSTAIIIVTVEDNYSVEMIITFKASERYYEDYDLEYGNLSDASDPLDEIPTSSTETEDEETTGCGGSLAADGLTLCIVLLLATAYAFVSIVITKKRNEK